MKQTIPLTELSDQERDYIITWRTIKKYPHTDALSIGEVMELLIAFSRNLRQEWSDGRFFNFILSNDESVIAWDGEELIDIMVFEFHKNFQNRMSTFTEEVSP